MDSCTAIYILRYRHTRMWMVAETGGRLVLEAVVGQLVASSIAARRWQTNSRCARHTHTHTHTHVRS